LERRQLLSVAGFRPSAVPLLTGDPYFSVWSESNNLTDTNTVQWDGNTQELVSLIRVDGTTYRLMGDDPSSLAAFPQTGLTVTATRSIYTFSNGHVAVTMTFETAALPDNLDVLTRPLSYITWAVNSVDGLTHQVQIYDSSSSELTVDDTAQQVQWTRQTDGSLTVLQVGNATQTLFSPAGDEVSINWGYLYESAPTAQTTQAIGGDAAEATAFESAGQLGNREDTSPEAVNADQPVLAFAFSLGAVGTAVVSRHVEVAYDELYEVNYFGQNLLPYWKRDGETMLQLLATADSQYATLAADCASFDTDLNTDLNTAGGAEYAQLAELAYRQALSATGIAADANGQPLLFTKEQTSNGDIATADVLFPTDPIFFLLNPTLAKASLVPLLSFASSGLWTQAYAPHDLGTYPAAEDDPSGNDGDEQQPVEESGNMLIMVDTIAHEENSTEFANNYWGQLTQWAQYLVPYAYDPGSQLTTDDFLGTIQSSTNLAIKAIEALGAYAQMCSMRGDTTDATYYRDIAAADVTHLLSVASDGSHLRLGYYLPGTWSEDYNLVWDKILGLNLFPASVAAEEVAYYKTVITPLGLQVESTNSDAKTDWAIWTASLATNTSDFQTLVAPEYNFINTTTDRVPLQDGYSTTNLDSGFFFARSVVGGLFIRMLEFPAIWSRYAAQDTTVLTGWAPVPTAVPVLPDAQTSPQTWLYTTTTPPANWTSQSFNDTSWPSGPGGFGPGAIINTTWSGINTIYLRKSFTMPAGTFADLEIQAIHDEIMTVYIDGVQATYAPGYITSYENFSIAPAALALLKPGATVEIAVSCVNTGGGQDIDVGLVNLTYIAPELPDALTIPQVWKDTTTTPPSNWTSQSFDDSSWSSGLGGFGNASTPGALVNTSWLGVDTICLRKSWTVPTGNLSNLEVQAYHDEDMTVYIDGVQAVSVTGYQTQYNLFTIAPAALALLTPGATVVFAVSCVNTGGGQDIDVGIVNVASTPNPDPAPAVVVPVPAASAAQPGAAVPPAAGVGAHLTAVPAPPAAAVQPAPAKLAGGGAAPLAGSSSGVQSVTPLAGPAAMLTPTAPPVAAVATPVTNPVKAKPTAAVTATGLVAAAQTAIGPV
jgi:hypothetical protein